MRIIINVSGLYDTEEYKEELLLRVNASLTTLNELERANFINLLKEGNKLRVVVKNETSEGLKWVEGTYDSKIACYLRIRNNPYEGQIYVISCQNTLTELSDNDTYYSSIINF